MPLPTMGSTFKPKRRMIDLSSFGTGPNRQKYDPSLDSDDDLRMALNHLLQSVGHDLGVEDETDDAFQDYAGDTLSDYGVPSEKIDQILADPKIKRKR